MKESMWATAIVIAGIIGVGFIILFVNITVNDQNDYYTLKEVTESAMMDSIDKDYYRYHGKFRIVREKFVENFIRRFSASYSINGDVQIVINDVIEMPPKVSISIVSSTDNFGITSELNENQEYQIINSIDGILEAF